MSLSDHGKNLALDLLIGSNQTTPATVYVALCTAEPIATDTGSTITEPTVGAYARVSVTNNSTNFGAASSSRKANAVAVTFPTATADWGTCRYWAICDASSGGNLLMFGRLTTPRAVPSGTTPNFAIDKWAITAD